MEQKEPLSRDELFDREERCSKAIRTVARAIFIRIAVSGLLIWVVLAVNHTPVVIGLAAFVLLMNLMGSFPLVRELRKRLREQKELRAME